MKAEPQPVTARRAMEIAEITYRQLDYFARAELVRPDVPPVAPNVRPVGELDAEHDEAALVARLGGYSFAAVTRLVVVKRLLGLGVSLPEIKRVLLQGPPAGIVRPVPHVATGLGDVWEGVADEVRSRMFRSRGPSNDDA